MEKNIPGLRKKYHLHLARLRADKLSLSEATRLLAIWSARYCECVSAGEAECGDGCILNAYSRREALKQYIEELKGNQNHVRT